MTARPGRGLQLDRVAARRGRHLPKGHGDEGRANAQLAPEVKVLCKAGSAPESEESWDGIRGGWGGQWFFPGTGGGRLA